MKKNEFTAKRSLRPVYYKSIELKDLKVDKESRKVSGYIAAFGNIDSDGDILVKGCFAKSIRERGPQSTTYRKIAYLWMHDMTDPIGRFTKLEEDDRGLYFEAEVDKIPQGDRALIQYESGTLNQHSIGYRYVYDKCEWKEVEGENGEMMTALVCNEINLFEGSVVTLGANENTPYTGMKGEQIADARKSLQKETETLLKDFEPEAAYKIRQIISRHVALAEADEPPVKALETEGEPQGIDWDKVLNLFNEQQTK